MGIGAMGAGAGLSAVGAFNQGTAQQGVLGYEASVANNNATLANYQASVAAQVGAQNEQSVELKTAQLMGTQKADMAANGIVMGPGSANEVLASSKYMGERDAMTVQNNTANQVWADQMQAQNYTSEANADNAEKKAISPILGAASSLLGTAGQVAPYWYRNLNNTKGN